MLWIDYFRERDTTPCVIAEVKLLLWIDYFRERDTTAYGDGAIIYRCGLITLGNEIQFDEAAH